MPLDTASLQIDLGALFAAPPPTAAACATAWALALRDYAAAVVPPSVAVKAAATTLQAALAAAFAAPGAGPAVDAALVAFAASVGAGMAPAFVATPPPAPPLGIVLPLLATPSPSHAAGAALFAASIDAWFRTGSATLAAPPFTVLVWS